MTTSPASSETTILSLERQDLLQALTTHRRFLRTTADGLTDEQARHRSTVSELTVGGIIKHVAETEGSWATFMAGGDLPGLDVDWQNLTPEQIEGFQQRFLLGADETVADAIREYEEVAAHTDHLVATLDLDQAYPLPPAPWFQPGATWSVRRAITHILAETSQHAGHADIIRESIDGAKTMG